jgi:uncharacterized RDD family membrane protein YckC
MADWHFSADYGTAAEPVATPVRGLPDYALAGWWSRVGASVVDSLVLVIPAIVLAVVLHQWTRTEYLSSAGITTTTYTTHYTWIDALMWLVYAGALATRSGVRNGQTIGMQALRIRMLRDDGEPVSLWTVVIREGIGKASIPWAFIVASSSLRAVGVIVGLYLCVDYLWPLWERQNRALHDLLAGTHVVSVDGREQKPTFTAAAAAAIVAVADADADATVPRPRRWFTPMAAIIAAGVVIAALVAVLDKHTSPQSAGVPGSTTPPVVNAPITSGPVPLAAGFANASKQRPVLGVWEATATVTSAVGYGDEAAGDQYERAWTIERQCGLPSGCELLLVRQLADGSKLGGKLTSTRDGWRATFPEMSYVCGQQDGQTLLWLQHDSMALNFTDGGRRASVNERDYSTAPACGYGTDTVVWSASHS